MATQDGYRLEVDLAQQTIRKPNGETVHFQVEAFRKKSLLEGLDEIEFTLKDNDEIQAYEGQLKPFQLIDLSMVID